MRSDLISTPRSARPPQVSPETETQAEGGVARAVGPLLAHFFGASPPVRVQFWDGTSLGPENGDTLLVCSPDAVRRILWSPGELGVALHRELTTKPAHHVRRLARRRTERTCQWGSFRVARGRPLSF